MRRRAKPAMSSLLLCVGCGQQESRMWRRSSLLAAGCSFLHQAAPSRCESSKLLLLLAAALSARNWSRSLHLILLTGCAGGGLLWALTAVGRGATDDGWRANTWPLFLFLSCWRGSPQRTASLQCGAGQLLLHSLCGNHFFPPPATFGHQE